MEGRSTGPGDGEKNNNNNSFNVEEGLFKVSCDAPVSEAEPVTLQVAPNGPNGEAEVVALLDGNQIHFAPACTASQQTTLRLEACAEALAWSPGGSYAVVGDASGALNFILKSGQLLFRHPLGSPAEAQVSGDAPQAAFFRFVHFVVPPRGQRPGSVVSEELVVGTEEGRIFHFSNIVPSLIEVMPSSSGVCFLLLSLRGREIRYP